MSVHDPQPGQRLGPYRLEEPLGEGAVGLVYRATRVADGAVVALKVLRPRLSADREFVQRFLHEARAAQEAESRHLVPIVDAGEADGRHYLAASFVAGSSLERRIEAAGPLPIEDVVRVVAHVAAGLDALHRHKLIHRDVKPSNILLDEQGGAALTDFGLAKGPAYTVLTKPGQLMGTLDYMAPELIRGEEATPATDLYALGGVAFECLAGTAPFGHRGLLEVATAHLEEEPPDPCAGRPDAPAGLSWAALQALAKDPAARPPTAIAYAHLLRAAASA
jgi:serine/threonine-protein kinase